MIIVWLDAVSFWRNQIEPNRVEQSTVNILEVS